MESLKAENVYPRLAFHYGIPSEAAKLAYDPVQKIVAISTKYVTSCGVCFSSICYHCQCICVFAHKSSCKVVMPLT